MTRVGTDGRDQFQTCKGLAYRPGRCDSSDAILERIASAGLLTVSNVAEP